MLRQPVAALWYILYMYMYLARGVGSTVQIRQKLSQLDHRSVLKTEMCIGMCPGQPDLGIQLRVVRHRSDRSS